MEGDVSWDPTDQGLRSELLRLITSHSGLHAETTGGLFHHKLVCVKLKSLESSS